MGQKIKIYLLTVLILLSCLLGGCALNEETLSSDESQILIPEVFQDVYVYDQAELISDDQEAIINNLLVQLEEKTTVEFAVITIPSLNNLTIEQYAVKLARELGIGKAEENNGILLLVSKDDAEVRLEIGVGLQGILPDSLCGRTLDKYFVPSREKGNYDDACFNTVHSIINSIADSEEYEFSEIKGLDPEVAVEAEDEITAGEVIGIIILVIVLLILEWITGYWLGDGFGDGIVILLLHILFSDSSDGGGGSFGGGRFNGGGSSR